MAQKLKKIVIAFMLIGSANLLANNASLVDSAKNAYDKANYKEAITIYKKIIASGETSYKLHYNLANAYYKNNEIGKAIYQYQLAHKLNPSDEDVKHNLTIANKHTKDQIESKENYFAKNIESGVLHGLSTTGWAWSSIFTLCFAMLSFALFTIVIKYKKILFWLGSIATLSCIVSFTIGYIALQKIITHKNAVIIVEEVSALNAPTEDAKEQFRLHEGTKVNVLETNSNWTSIQLENGNEAWVKTKDLGLF